MQGIAASLSAEDMDNLGIYFSEQKLQLSAATSNGIGSKGEKIFRAGIKDSGVPPVQAVTALQGMEYLIFIPDLMLSIQTIY